MVAAAGNERSYGATEVSYPASSPFVLSVGASTIGGLLSEYSNPGSFGTWRRTTSSASA